jgi:hypothetical protein
MKMAVESHWHWHHSPLHLWLSPWNSKVDLHPTLCMEQWHHQHRTHKLLLVTQQTLPYILFLLSLVKQWTHILLCWNCEHPLIFGHYCHWWNTESIMIFFMHKFNYFSTFLSFVFWLFEGQCVSGTLHLLCDNQTFNLGMLNFHVSVLLSVSYTNLMTTVSYLKFKS